MSTFTSSQTRRASRAPLALLAATLFLLAGVFSAQAQLSVRAAAKRPLYLAGESVQVEVVITNLAGREIVLSSNQTAPWLGFDLRTRDGDMIPARVRAEIPDLVIPAGQTMKQSVAISDFFPLQQAGDFTVRAWVYFADLKDYNYSSTTNFTVAPGRVIWQQTVGVPMDEAGGGSYRTYEVQTLKEMDRIRIFVLVKDKTTGQVLQCFTLGNLVSVVNPQATIDQSNQLHVLFMTGPQLLQHVIVRHDGALIASDRYRVTNKYPRLVRNGLGQVGVAGGVKMTAATVPTDPATGEAIQPSLLSDRPE